MVCYVTSVIFMLLYFIPSPHMVHHATVIFIININTTTSDGLLQNYITSVRTLNSHWSV